MTGRSNTYIMLRVILGSPPHPRIQASVHAELRLHVLQSITGAERSIAHENSGQGANCREQRPFVHGLNLVGAQN